MKSKLLEKLRNSSFVTSVLKVGSGQLIGQLLSVVSVPILSRIYLDSAYGEHALVISTATLMINITTFGLNSAIMKPQEDNEAKKVFTTAFVANLLITSIFVLACFCLVNVFTLFSVHGSYIIALLLMWVYIVLTNLSGLLNTYACRKEAYNRLFFNPIIGSAANFVIAIPLGLLHFGYEGLLITGILSNLAICIHLAWHDVPILINFKLRDFISVIREFREYVLFQYPSNFIDNTSYEYPTQYLGRVFSTQTLGGYAMCIRVLKYPLRLIAAPISTVYFRTASKYHNEGRNIADFTYRMISRILIVSFIPVALFSCFSESIFIVILGETWKEAGRIASVLCVQYVMMFCSQCTSYCRVAIDRQKINLAFSCIRLVLVISSTVLGYIITRTAIGTITIMSVAQCLFWILDMTLNFYCMNKKTMSKYLFISIVYAVLVYLIVFMRAGGIFA